MSKYDPENLTYKRSSKPAKTHLGISGVVKRKPGFVKGPIPLPWIASAAKCKGRALHTALLLCYLSGVQGRDTIKVGNQKASNFGLSRSSKLRGLQALEAAGLIKCDRKSGRNPVVTILWD